MTQRQVICWVNVMLKTFALVMRSINGKYALNEIFEIQGLIERKSLKGTFYIDRENKLKHLLQSDDLFIYDELSIVRGSKNRRNDYDISLLDIGINID